MNCTSWPPRGTRNTERRIATPPRLRCRGGVVLRALAGIFGIAFAFAAAPTRSAHAAESARFAFAVIGNAIGSQNDEAAAQKLIDAIGRDPRISFVVYDGNLKAAGEPCGDALYERRHALLEASRPALVFVPGQHDWATCSSAASGGYDPVERLDLLRQTIFSDPSSLGQNPLSLTRESEVPRFRPYRENVRWQAGDTVFVAMNLPDGNNHYLTAGGRNGEFEDRVIANGFWLEHAAEYAKRRNARAIVIFVQGNPWATERRERSERFGWLRFGHRPRDGYVEFRRSLAKLAQTFDGPVLVVHMDDAKLPRGFEIDQPLKNDKGATIANVTRIAVALRDPATQWLHMDADMERRPPLRIGVRDVPKRLPPLPPQAQPPLLPRDGETPALPDMPEISSMPNVTEVPQGVPEMLQQQAASGGFAPPQPASPATPPAGGAGYLPQPAAPAGAGAMHGN
nr:hypothetical protein [Paraburkholderia caballeronis]